jgi:hypothetical protein
MAKENPHQKVQE